MHFNCILGGRKCNFHPLTQFFTFFFLFFCRWKIQLSRCLFIAEFYGWEGTKLVLCFSFIIFTATYKSLQDGCSKILIYYSWLGFIGYGTVWFYRHILLYGVHTHFVVLEFLIGAENILQLLLINKGLSGGMRLFLCVCSKTKGRQTEQLLRKYNKREDDIYGKLSYCVSFFLFPAKQRNQ